MRKYILLFVLLFYCCSPIKKYKNTASVFEQEILNLEKLDSIKQATKEDLLFIGSSSVRLWKEIERDMILMGVSNIQELSKKNLRFRV